MRDTTGETREAVIPLLVEERADGSFSMTTPIDEMFHVVGKTKEQLEAAAQTILKEHLERNYPVKVVELRFTDYARKLFPELVPALPAHVIAELSA